jgi:hypothetical protein
MSPYSPEPQTQGILPIPYAPVSSQTPYFVPVPPPNSNPKNQKRKDKKKKNQKQQQQQQHQPQMQYMYMQAPAVPGVQFLSQPQTHHRLQSPNVVNNNSTAKRRLSEVIDRMNVPPSPSSGKISDFTREESENLERNLLLHGFHFQNGEQADQQRKKKMNDYLPDDQARDRDTQYE